MIVLKNKTRSKIDDERDDKIRARMKGKKVADKSGTTEERKLDRTRSMAIEIKRGVGNKSTFEIFF